MLMPRSESRTGKSDHPPRWSKDDQGHCCTSRDPTYRRVKSSLLAGLHPKEPSVPAPCRQIGQAPGASRYFRMLGQVILGVRRGHLWALRGFGGCIEPRVFFEFRWHFSEQKWKSRLRTQRGRPIGLDRDASSPQNRVAFRSRSRRNVGPRRDDDRGPMMWQPL